MADSFLNIVGLPLGLRNNNPGNIRVTGDQWQGMIGSESGMVRFQDVTYGIRAMATILGNDIIDGTNTITSLISQYAPPSENDTAAYINYVVQDTSYDANQELPATSDTLFKLIRAQMKEEIGQTYAAMISDDDVNQGINMMNSDLLSVFGSAAGGGSGFQSEAILILAVSIIIYFITRK